jgi:hypothetical protein
MHRYETRKTGRGLGSLVRPVLRLAGLPREGLRSVTVLDRYGYLLPGSEDKVNDALDALANAATATPTAPVVPLARDGRGTRSA